MTDGKDEQTVRLIFPKSRCAEKEIKGVPMISVDTKMTAMELVMMLLRLHDTGEPIASIIKEESE